MFGIKISVPNSTHGRSVCWYLLYKYSRNQSSLRMWIHLTLFW